MRIVSGLIRVITGLAIMAMALYVYLGNQAQLEGTDPVTVVIVGQELTATPTQILIGLIAAAAVGGMIELLGIFTLVRKPPANAAQQQPAT
jgi:multisubunit Na+/H+ antiporter MnhB subunit